MAYLIKNQILKHLSKFTKNLSSDKINLSTLRGEGELSNLELNEAVLTDLLELPCWMRLTRAWCNRVSIRIHWTKLKSVPILLNLDEVQVEIETVDELRPLLQTSLPAYSSGGRYGFSDKVIDGMSVNVNALVVTFKSHAFLASFQVSRITLESRSPSWQRCDLRMTRLKEAERGELLIFKELQWQTLRIEAKSTKNEMLPPLRLITNQARCRITIKKKLADCSVLSCCLVLILDDLLWVLTDSQLKAALHFLDSLSGLVQKATELSHKTKAARKLDTLPEYQAQLLQQARGLQRSALSRVFSRYDVVETSYHFYSDKINFHFCDDPGDGRSCHPELQDGGAFQVSLVQLQVDYYPYHLASGDRRHWIRYKNGILCQWLDQSLSAFKTTMLDIVHGGKTHTPLSRAPPHPAGPAAGAQGQGGSPQDPRKQTSPNTPTSPNKNIIIGQLHKLMSACLVLRVNDLVVWKVETTKQKPTSKEFISGDCERFSVPEDTPILHAEFTQYYYPGSMDFPLPAPKLYLYVNPVQIIVDELTIFWLNAFALNLKKSLASEQGAESYLDVKLEGIMPRVIFECTGEYPMQRDRPKSVHLQTSRLVVMNHRTLELGSRADLAKCLEDLQEGNLFFGSDFPSVQHDLPIVIEKFVHHATAADNVRPPVNLSSSSPNKLVTSLRKDSLWTDAKDMWFVHMDPFWVDFHGVPAARNHSVPFVDTFPLVLWIYQKPKCDIGSKVQPGATYSSGRRQDVLPECEESITSQEQNQDAKRRHRHMLMAYYSLSDNEGEASSASVSKSDTSCEKSGLECQENKIPSTADMHIIAHITSLVSVQLNHYQYLFLLRVMERLLEITTILTKDTCRILQLKHATSMCVGTTIPQLDVSLLMPAQNPGKESSGGDIESVLPDSSSLTDVHETDHSEGGAVYSPPGGSTENQFCDFVSTENHGLSEESVAKSPTGSISDSNSTPSPIEMVPNFSSSIQGMGLVEQSVEMNGSVVAQHIIPSQVTPNTLYTSKKSLGLTFGQNGPIPQLNFQDNLNVGFGAMRKGLTSGITNLMSSIDSALKASPDDASDTLSVRSDGSSDSENFVMVNLETANHGDTADALFRTGDTKRPASIEIASEVVEESSSDQSCASSCKRRDLICALTFRLSKVELSQQSSGYNSCLKLQCADIGYDECPSISWDEFQTKFSSRGRGWHDCPTKPSGGSSLKLRMVQDAGDPTELVSSVRDSLQLREGLQKTLDAFLDLSIKDMSFQLYFSTLAGIADLLEDEIIPIPLPMKALFENITVRVIEDRPSANITSPGSVPVDVKLPKVLITRKETGLFCIEPLSQDSNENGANNTPKVPERSYAKNRVQTCPTIDPTIESSVSHKQYVSSRESNGKFSDAAITEIKKENEELRKRFQWLEVLEKENYALKEKVEEINELQLTLKKIQHEKNMWLEEKSSLMHTIRFLEEKLFKAGKHTTHSQCNSNK